MTVVLSEMDFPLGIQDLGRFQQELEVLSWSVAFLYVTRIYDGSNPATITLHFAGRPNIGDVGTAAVAMGNHDGLETPDEWADLLVARGLGITLTVNQQHRLFDFVLAG